MNNDVDLEEVILPKFWSEKANVSKIATKRYRGSRGEDNFSQFDNFRLMMFDDQRVSLQILQRDFQAPSKSIQKQEISKILDSNVIERAGDIWCVISKRWFLRWKKFVSFNTDSISSFHPGSIDNSDLVVDEMSSVQQLVKLREDVVENRDFVTIPCEAWNKLLRWYGGENGGYAPTIARLKYLSSGKIVLDLYPIFLKCCFSGNGEIIESDNFGPHVFNLGEAVRFVEMRFSYKYERIGKIREFLNLFYGIDFRRALCVIADTRLWCMVAERPDLELIADPMEGEDSQLCYYDKMKDRRMRDGDLLILEPRYLTEKYFSDPYYYRPSFQRHKNYGVRISLSSEFTKKWTFEKVRTTLLTVQGKHKNGNETIIEFLRRSVHDPWKKSFSVEEIMNEKKKKDVTIDPKFNPRDISSDFYLIFKFIKKEHYREFVVVKILDDRSEDIDEKERIEFMLGLEYNTTNMNILELSFKGGNDFVMEITKVLFI